MSIKSDFLWIGGFSFLSNTVILWIFCENAIHITNFIARFL